jgi:hypothetical protein
MPGRLQATRDRETRREPSTNPMSSNSSQADSAGSIPVTRSTREKALQAKRIGSSSPQSDRPVALRKHRSCNQRATSGCPQDRCGCPRRGPPWIPGGYTTGTYPPWPRPLRASPTHSTGGPDGGSEYADDRVFQAALADDGGRVPVDGTRRCLALALGDGPSQPSSTRRAIDAPLGRFLITSAGPAFPGQLA